MPSQCGPGHSLGVAFLPHLCGLILLLTLEISPKRWLLPLTSDLAPDPNSDLVSGTLVSSGDLEKGSGSGKQGGWKGRGGSPDPLFQPQVALRLPQLPALLGATLAWAWPEQATGALLLGLGARRDGLRPASALAGQYQACGHHQGSILTDSLCSLVLWVGSGLKGDLHTRMGQGTPKSWCSVP